MSARTRFFAGPIQGRTHRSAPTRSGKISAAHKTILCGSLCHGAGRSPPPTGGAGVDRRRGEVTPPYGSSAGGAQRRADVGIGPYALRGDERAARRGRRALRVVAESRRDCPGQRRTAKRLRQRVRRNGWESRQRSPPKGPSTQDNPSVSLRLTAPFAQGSLWGRGVRSAASAPTEGLPKSQQQADVGIGPYGWLQRAAATTLAALSEAESAGIIAGQIRFLPDDLFVQHGVPCSEVSVRPRPCSRRGCVH